MKVKQKDTSINMEDKDGNEAMCYTYIRESENLGINKEDAEKICNMYGLKDPKIQKDAPKK